jgi:PAS domain-containing protein
VNEFVIALAALGAVLAVALGVWWSQGRSRKNVERQLAPHRAVFEQSPDGALMVDANTLKVVDANPAFQRNLGYTLAEVRALTAADLFTDGSGEPELLLRKLRDPNPRLP